MAWTKEQRAKFRATMRSKKASDGTHPAHRNGSPDKLIRLAAKLIRLLPDDKLIELVK